MDELKDIFSRAAKELVLTPSPEIWEGVRRSIDRRKKKRMVIFWFVILGILLAVLAIFSAAINTSLSETGKGGKQPATAGGPDRYLGTKASGEAMLHYPSGHAKETNKTKRFAIVATAHASRVNTRQGPLRAQPAKLSDTPVGLKVELLRSLPAISGRNISSINPAAFLQPRIAHTYQVIDSSVTALATSSFHLEGDDESRYMTFETQAASSELDEVNNDTAGPVATKEAQIQQYVDTLLIDNVVKKSRWGIGICITPGISYNRLAQDDTNKFIANYRNATGRSALNFNYGVSVHYLLGERITISSGLMIMNISEIMQRRQAAYRFDTINGGPQPDIRVSEIRTGIAGDSSGMVRNRFTYLSIPLNLNFRLAIRKKLSLGAEVGIGIDRVVNVKGYYYNFNRNVYEKLTSVQVATWLFSAEASMGVQYTFRGKLMLGMAPYWRIWPSSVYSSSYTLSQHFFQVGLKFSARFFFK